MGKGKKLFFGSLFGFEQESAGSRQTEEPVAAQSSPKQKYYQGTRVRPRNDEDDYGNYYGRYGYGDCDIDKKATEFIERVHRGMHTSDKDG